MYRFSQHKLPFFGLLILTLVGIQGCKKYLPTDRDFFDSDARFTQTVFTPTLGRNTLFTNAFNAATSSQPLTFKILNIRRRNGDPAPELVRTFPVLVWKQAYTGKEKSLEEINDKRAWEQHPFFEVRQHSGDMMMWAAANSNYLHCQPDSGYLFDVEVSNSGGRRYYTNLKLMPFHEQPYEPTNEDPVTGANLNPPVHPSQVTNVKGSASDLTMGSGDISIFFHKTGDGVNVSGKDGAGYNGTLTFKFLDSALHPINPDNFNLTNWKGLVHGFNMKKTTESVSYEVAYPIPLNGLPTPYTTNDGNQAHVEFSYARQGFGNIRQVATIDFNFNIYQPGDWEIIFWFNKESPKFSDD